MPEHVQYGNHNVLLVENGNDGTTRPPFHPPREFSLAADPGTDIWRKPPLTVSFNAPILYTTIQLSNFKRARVTVRGDWKTLFDQGGLCLWNYTKHQAKEQWKWVKAGIEFFDGKPHIGTVTCDTWADWSLTEFGGNEVTVEMEREVEKGEKTSSLWVYIVEAEGKKKPIREITWVFNPLDGNEQENHYGVGAYAAKPTPDEDEKESRLEVSFNNFEIETWDGMLQM